jgi:hypothetical protein
LSEKREWGFGGWPPGWGRAGRSTRKLRVWPPLAIYAATNYGPVRGHILPPHQPGYFLEAKFQPQLHDSCASRSEHRVSVDDVRRAASAAERVGDRWIVADIGANHAAVGIGEMGMIKHVEELNPEFSAVSLLPLEVLEYGEVQIPEARITEETPAHRAEGSKNRRHHHRVALHVAAARRYTRG